MRNSIVGIEQQEYERLIQKEAAAQALLRDQVETPLTRDMFLAELKDVGRS